MTKSKKPGKTKSPAATGYDAMLSGVAGLLDEARRTLVLAVNAIMAATYWGIGRRIVEYEQGGKGLSRQNLQRFRELYLMYPPGKNCSTLSSKSNNTGSLQICPIPLSKTKSLVAEIDKTRKALESRRRGCDGGR